MTVYVVHMFRWGDEELHSYVHCVCATEATAKTMGQQEKENRDNKYQPKIVPFEILEKPMERCVDCNNVYDSTNMKGWYCQACSNTMKTTELELADPAFYGIDTTWDFNCDCGLTPEEIYKDVASMVKLTGSETPGELENLHQSIFHSFDDEDTRDYSNEDFPTAKELSVETKAAERRAGQLRCSVCPPHKGENAGRKPKRGAQKKLKVNKKQGRAVKAGADQYFEDRPYNIKNAGRRK